MLLIGNGRLVTRDDQNPYFENGAVAVDGDQIVEVGEYTKLKELYAHAEFVDAKGGWIMPGMINCHNHIYSAFARGLSIVDYHPKDFSDILSGMWWNIDKKLTLDMVRYSAYAIYLECLRNGVTTVFDHHASYLDIEGSLFTIAEVAKELGIRTNLCFEISDRNGWENMKKAVQESVSFIREAERKDNDLCRAMMGLHASFTLSDETLQYCNQQKPSNVGYHVHVAEGFSDLQNSLQRSGKRVVQRLFDHGILGEESLAVHCVHINHAEMEILRETNTPVIHNPESNMGNAVGCGAVPLMYQNGVLLGLGTDGYTSDMYESYKVGNLIHKHQLCDPTVAYRELPEMLFSGNAQIANRHLKGKIGSLQKGYYADVITVDYRPFTPCNASNINSHLLFGVSGKDVTNTIVNGRWILKEREIVGVDSERVLCRAQELAQKLWHIINS